jgi:hypothetical protein
MANTVAKLYVANGAEWKDSGIWGVASVTMDRTPPKAVLIQIYDIKVQLSCCSVRFC